MKYQARPVPVQAIQINMPMQYIKWGGYQDANVGDWLLSKGGDTYTCDKQVFAETYRPLPGREGWFFKVAEVDAVRVEADGAVETIEGASEYKAGDYIVTNPGGDQYPVSADKFDALYQPVGGAS